MVQFTLLCSGVGIFRLLLCYRVCVVFVLFMFLLLLLLLLNGQQIKVAINWKKTDKTWSLFFKTLFLSWVSTIFFMCSFFNEFCLLLLCVCALRVLMIIKRQSRMKEKKTVKMLKEKQNHNQKPRKPKTETKIHFIVAFTKQKFQFEFCSTWHSVRPTHTYLRYVTHTHTHTHSYT